MASLVSLLLAEYVPMASQVSSQVGSLTIFGQVSSLVRLDMHVFLVNTNRRNDTIVSSL